MIAFDYKKIAKWLLSFSGKKVLWVVIASFVIASGLSIIFSYQLIPDDSRTSRGRRVRIDVDIDRQPLTDKDEDIILKRNIFNSEGTLGDVVEGADEDQPARTPGGALVKSSLPLKLHGVIFAGDPFNGLAMIENSQKRRTNSYIVGDTIVNAAKLVEVYEDRVILENSGTREYVEMENWELVRTRRKGKSSPLGRTSGIGQIATRLPPESYQEDGFERKGNEIKLTEEFKRSLLTADTMSKVLQDAKAEPNMVGGELKGFRLTRIRENSIYEKAGFRNGDIVEEINGIPLRDAAGAIRLLQQLRNSKEIEVRVNRGGVVEDMFIVIQ